MILNQPLMLETCNVFVTAYDGGFTHKQPRHVPRATDFEKKKKNLKF